MCSKCVQSSCIDKLLYGFCTCFIPSREINAECWLNISLTHPFLSQKHTKEVGRPQTPLKETALEPWTQPQVGWNNFSDHLFSVRVVSVSIHGNNLQRSVAAGCSVVLLSHVKMIWFWLPRLLVVPFELKSELLSKGEMPALPCLQLVLEKNLQNLTKQNYFDGFISVSINCEHLAQKWSGGCL